MPSARPSNQTTPAPVVRLEAPPTVDKAPRTPWRERARRAGVGHGPAALALAGYLAFALFITWPWVIDPTERLYGVVGDLTANVAGFQQFAEERQPPFLPGRLTQINAPEGLPINWALHVAAIGSSTALWLLSLAIGSVAAHGVIAVTGYALSAFAMFLLARSITGHAGAAFVVGLAFGFWPYMYGTGYTWPHYIHLWVLVLVVWRMLVVADAPTPRNGLFAGLAAAFAMTWIAYNLLIAGVVFATLAVLAIARAALSRSLRPQLMAQGIATAIVVTVVMGLLLAGRTSGWAGVPIRGSTDSVANSARPAMYVVPGPEHPLLGDRTGPWLFERFSPTVPNPPPGQAIYADIYLGAPLVFLALIGIVWTLARLFRQPRSVLTKGPVWGGIVATVLAAVAFAFSAPPKVSVFGVLIPMPYTFVEYVTTVFRVPVRFATVLMLAVCLLAALTLAALLRHRAFFLQAAAVALLAAVVVVDLRAMPSPSTSRIERLETYKVLREQPPGIVAEYPLNRGPVVESEESLLQEQHDHPLFAGAPVGSESEGRKSELQYLLASRTVPDLAAYGVDYVLVRHQPSVAPGPGESVRGLSVISSDPVSTLYRVVAEPALFTSYGVHGFHGMEGNPPGMRWVGANDAKLELRGRCRPCVGTVTFRAASFAQPRVLRVHDERGRQLYTGRVEANGTLVRFPVRFSGRAVVRLSTDPPPVVVSSVIGGPDTRSVSVSVAQPVRFMPEPRRGHRPLP